MINTSQSPGHRAAIHAIRCLYPLLVLLYYGVATTSSTCALHSVSSKFRDEKARRKLIVILELLFLSTYVSLQPRLSNETWKKELCFQRSWRMKVLKSIDTNLLGCGDCLLHFSCYRRLSLVMLTKPDGKNLFLLLGAADPS
jgi:hypothetical protein